MSKPTGGAFKAMLDRARAYMLYPQMVWIFLTWIAVYRQHEYFVWILMGSLLTIAGGLFLVIMFDHKKVFSDEIGYLWEKNPAYQRLLKELEAIRRDLNELKEKS